MTNPGDMIDLDPFSDSCTERDVPTCPKCGERREDWWDTSSEWKQDVTREIDCYTCDTPYRVMIETTYTFHCDWMARKPK